MKTFYNLLVNTVISSVTNFTVWFAIIFFGYIQTQSVLVTSIMSGIYLIATAATGFWFGELVDKNKKKKLLVASGIFSLVMYLICFVIYISVGADTFKDVSNPILWVFIIFILLGVIGGNIRGIVLPALIPVLVDKDKLDKANGLAGTASGISFLIVSVISGLLVGLGGMYWVLILAIVLILASTVHLYFIQIPEKEIIHTQEESQKVNVRATLKIILGVPGLMALIFFTTINNFLGGVFMSLMDAYGLSLVSVEVWGILWGVLSCAFIIGGIIITKRGLGKNPLKVIFMVNILIWIISSLFTIQHSILLLMIGMFIYLMFGPFIEAAEHTVIQKVVPQEKLGRVFGFAQSVEQAASPITSFAIGPITQLIFIPFMTVGDGVRLIGSWFGTGPARGIALVFTLTGIIGLIVTLIAYRSKFYKQLSAKYISATN